MAVATYDPKRIALTIGGVLITGFGENSIVKHERNADSFTKKVGADGKVTRSRSADRSSRITISQQQASVCNDYLSTLLRLDEAGAGGSVVYSMFDTNGTTRYSSGSCWIVRAPDDERANESGDIEWILDCAEMDGYLGSILGE